MCQFHVLRSGFQLSVWNAAFTTEDTEYAEITQRVECLCATSVYFGGESYFPYAQM